MVCVCACDALANGATRADQPAANVYLSDIFGGKGGLVRLRHTVTEVLPERIARRRCDSRLVGVAM